MKLLCAFQKVEQMKCYRKNTEKTGSGMKIWVNVQSSKAQRLAFPKHCQNKDKLITSENTHRKAKATKQNKSPVIFIQYIVLDLILFCLLALY